MLLRSDLAVYTSCCLMTAVSATRQVQFVLIFIINAQTSATSRVNARRGDVGRHFDELGQREAPWWRALIVLSRHIKLFDDRRAARRAPLRCARANMPSVRAGDIFALRGRN